MKKQKPVRVIDIGGSGIRMADVRGMSVSQPREIHFPRLLLRKTPLDYFIDQIMKNVQPGTIGFAISMAASIDDHDLVVKSPNAHLFGGTRLATAIMNRTNRKAVVCNDMEAAGTGMSLLFPKIGYFAALTISSGIGVRFIKNGKMISSQTEGGHIQIDPSPYAQTCGCGLRGCAEGIIGGKAVERRVLTVLDAYGVTLPEGMNPCAFLDQCWDHGDQWATDIYDMLAIGYGTLFATFQTLLVLPAIIWKGGLAKYILPRIESGIREEMRKRLRMNENWEDQLIFHQSPEPDGIVNYDAFIGAAHILSNM